MDTIAYVAGGWVVLKTLMGWRRVQDITQALFTMSMISILGSLLSVTAGIITGIVIVNL